MPVAAIYDIHGNLPALEAVLGAIDLLGIDQIVVGGDVAAGPQPRQTIARLMALRDRARFVRGNADREMVNAFDGAPPEPGTPAPLKAVAAWTAQQIDRSQRDFLASFELTVTLPIDGVGDVLFCHATPRNDTDVFTINTPAERLRDAFSGVTVPLVVCGHTHMQFDRMVGSTRVVNAGSVGMPYGDPGAYWLLIGGSITCKHTPYDLDAAADLIRRSGYPEARDFADHNVLAPPSAAEAVALFDQMAV